MTARFALAVLALGVVTLGGCSSTSRIEPELPAELAEFDASFSVQEIWTASVGALGGKHDSRLSPVLDGDMLYVANAVGVVRALSAENGETRWKVDLEAPVTGATGVGEGLVLVGTHSGEVIALDATSGERRWTSKVSSEVQAPPVARKGVVVVQTVDGQLTGLNSSDGKRLWVSAREEPALSLRGTGGPLIVSDFALAGFASGKIVAVSLRDGKLLWERVIAEPRGRNEIERLVDVDAPLLLYGETLFAVAYQGRVMAIDMRSGKVVWNRDASSSSSMDADRGALFVADDKGHVLAFDPRGGSNLWRQDKLHGRRLNGAVLHQKSVLVADAEGYLHWLAPDDGRFLARYRLDSSPVRVRAIAEGATVYVASSDGRVAALQLEPRR
jgi:outer membrane protein assembly factor BamB